MDLPCAFGEHGFLFDDGGTAIPCGSVYSSKCLRSGLPFKTRLANDKGLRFPKCDPGLFPNYICEACQVRAHLQRELISGSSDIALLLLERQRMLDTMCKWAEGTLGNYSGHYRRLKEFQEVFGVKTLWPTALLAPPRTPAIPTMWTQLLYSVQPSQRPKPGQEGSTITYNTSRQVRSASGLYYAWDYHMAYPGQCLNLESEGKHLMMPKTLPNEELSYTLQQAGMAARMGTSVQPSWTLQHRHIKYIDDRLEQQWNATSNPLLLHEIATAGAANLSLYTSWMRGGECFGIDREDVANYGPETGPRFGLPLGTGHIQFRLLPQTKSNPTQTADIVVARTCASGLSLGKWMDRLLAFPSYSAKGRLFSSPQKSEWNSRYFREKYAWRFLEDMRAEGEASLAAFTDEPGKRTRDKIWSCHSWRRCAESTVCKRRPGINLRAATNLEQHEHARWKWRNQAGKEPVAVHYRALELEERLALTLFCM